MADLRTLGHGDQNTDSFTENNRLCWEMDAEVKERDGPE